jgi:hypothetical protein
MSNPAEQIAEFRDIVETVIANNVEGQYGKWVGIHEQAQAQGLEYVSVSPTSSRPITVGLGPEHRWAMVSNNQRIGGYIGSVALLSLEGRDETLTRRVTIESAMGPFFGIESQRELSEPDELDLALSWARSPHLYPRNLKALSALTPGEKTKVTAEKVQLQKSAEELQKSLNAIRDARYRSSLHLDRRYLR